MEKNFFSLIEILQLIIFVLELIDRCLTTIVGCDRQLIFTIVSLEILLERNFASFPADLE